MLNVKTLLAHHRRKGSLSDPLSRVRRAAAKAAQARETFETEIRRAVRERTMRQVAEAAGLSAARVHQIVHAKRSS